MRGDVLDIVLVLATLLFAVSGYRQGLVVGLLSFVGFLGGGLLGAQLATPVADLVGGELSEPVIGLLVVFAVASMGQLLATAIGAALKGRLAAGGAQRADAIGGAVISTVSLLLVAWLVGIAVASSPFTGLARQVRSSAVLGAVDTLVPQSFRDLTDSFRRLVNEDSFPEVFGALQPTQVPEIEPPDRELSTSRAVRTAQPQVVKVTGVAQDCRKNVEGTGFAFARERVLTNAHVLAGVEEPKVQVGDQQFDARTVLYDPERDVAVLLVPGLEGTPLTFAAMEADDGDSAIVAGYPQGGPFRAEPARVRTVQQARGPDIYDEGSVTREVYALRARVRPGNSGGPLLSPEGRVYGLVFAAAADDADTGYALTADEVESSVLEGRTATAEVSTQGCD